MKHSFVISLIFALIINFGCSNKHEPGQKVLLIVSTDTLKADDVAREYASYVAEYGAVTDSFTSLHKDSIRKEIIQNWIDRKLILRQARNDNFKFIAETADSLHSHSDSIQYSAGKEAFKIIQYLEQVQNSNMVTKWEAKQEQARIRKETGKDIPLEKARFYLQRQRLLKWIRNLRGEGGYRVFDRSVSRKRVPYSIEKINTIDTSGGVIGSIVNKTFLHIDKKLVKSIVEKTNRVNKEDLDTEVLAAIAEHPENQAEGGVGTERVYSRKRTNRAHLYRTPESLQKTIAKYLPDVKLLFKKAEKRNPLIKGHVVVRMVIAEDGSVSGLDIVRSQIGDEGFLKEFYSSIVKWKFPKIPADAGEMVVNYPFDFTVE